MSTNWQEYVRMAQDLIKENGREVEFLRLDSGPADPDKPWIGAGTPIVAERVKTIAVCVPAISLSFGTDFANEELLKRVSEVFIVAADDAGTNFEKFHAIDDIGTRWTIEWGQILRPGPVKVLYLIGVSR